MPKIVAKKEDWILLGYKLFAENGIDGINVDKMSSILKCNKSSFYWHFKSKKLFMEQLVAYWVESHTQQIMDDADICESGLERFELLIKLTFKKDPYLDFIFFLKKYGLKNKKVKELIEQIDLQRINYTIDILKDLGYSLKDARIKSELFYKYLIGYHEMMRYSTQPKNYQSQVKKELSQFIKF